MSTAACKRVLLGISGGIAAYKSPDLVRRLRENGYEVRVVMTEAATAFIGPLALQAVSGEAVRTQLFDETAEAAMGHIELARWADVVLVAPATANTLAKLACGLADDLLTTLCLATRAPLVVAPAMNREMWANDATTANMRTLRARGVVVLGPDSGAQACGEVGEGRMLEPSAIAQELGRVFVAPVLDGLSVLITAGPTREPIDPVRYVSNHSSGKMGYAIARASAAAGGAVTLISGPVTIEAPARVERVMVETADEMFDAVNERVQDKDIFVSTAAVADYKPSHYADDKIKKANARRELELTPTRDILAHVASLARAPFSVGFAAETSSVREYAKGKLDAKRLDMIAANDVSRVDRGFGSDDNALSVFWPTGEHELELAPKDVIAAQLVDLIAKRFRETHPA